MPDNRYPKSREELEAEVADLKGKLATAESLIRVAGDELKRQANEIERLRRRRVPKPLVLDPKATDKFARPAFRRN